MVGMNQIFGEHRWQVQVLGWRQLPSALHQELEVHHNSQPAKPDEEPLATPGTGIDSS